ncbi:hypothetical protein EYF80_040754 [Liparis tanakae]|uniref:Uncharacterized protein n=1 Tax=Liparis tanakae TaxID=230148 RepID=A0A4Z2G656_9TELE|nr:hypothetical protein EYF80_040754 [Liparis tanakae]
MSLSCAWCKKGLGVVDIVHARSSGAIRHASHCAVNLFQNMLIQVQVMRPTLTMGHDGDRAVGALVQSHHPGAQVQSHCIGAVWPDAAAERRHDSGFTKRPRNRHPENRHPENRHPGQRLSVSAPWTETERFSTLDRD